MAKPIIFDIYARTHGEKDVGRLSQRMTALAAAGGVLAAKFAVDSVKAFTAAEQAQTRLSDAYAKFPKLSNVSIEALRSYNSELAKKTRFDDDATASGQAVLAQFGLTGAQIKTLTPLLQDYAAKTGKDLPSAAQSLGKAVLGQGRALKAVGIDFKDTGSAAGNLEQITAGLRRQVGGFAEKEGKTAAGQSAILTNQFGELQEQAGAKLVPALVRLAGVGLSVVGFIDRNQKVIVPLIAAFGALAAITWTVSKATVAWAAIQKVAAVATKLWTGAQWLLNAALTANPIGIVIVAVAALVTGIVIAYKRSETFRKIVDGAFRAVAVGGRWMWESVLKPAFTALGAAFGWVGRTAQALWSRVLAPTFRFIADAWLAVVGAIINGAARALGWVPGIGPKLKAAAAKFNQFRDEVNRALGGVRSRNVTVSATLTAGPVGRSSYAAAKGWRIPGYGGGDTVPIMAERGEAIIPKHLVPEIAGWASRNRIPGFQAGGVAGGVTVTPELRGRKAFGDSIDRFNRSLDAMARKMAGTLGGGSVGGGWQGMMAVLRRAFPGLALISGYRPGAITATGNRSYHASGRAVDVPPSMAVFNWIRANYGARTRELIFSPAGGRQLWNGRPHFYGEPTRGDHWDHVHWAYGRGGTIREQVEGIGLRTGARYTFGERGPETVTPGVHPQTQIVVNLTTIGQLDAQATNKVRQAIREALRAEGRPVTV